MKIKGHSLLKSDPNRPHKVKCTCGADSTLYCDPIPKVLRAAAREWHELHKKYVMARRLNIN